MVSFAVQSLTNLIRFHLFVFALFPLQCEPYLRRHHYHLYEKKFCFCSFLVFFDMCLTFKSWSHFEFIFVYGMRECSNFIDLLATVQLSQYHLLKRLSFFHCMLLPPLLKINCRFVGLFLGSVFYSVALYICFCANTVSFWLL